LLDVTGYVSVGDTGVADWLVYSADMVDLKAAEDSAINLLGFEGQCMGRRGPGF
jgi:hypothetical protein